MPKCINTKIHQNFFACWWKDPDLEPEFLNFQGTQASIPCEKSIPLWNGFVEASIPFEDIEDFRIVIVICCVREKETPNDQHISNTETILQLLAEDGMSISA
jgi:hypothetical protein